MTGNSKNKRKRKRKRKVDLPEKEKKSRSISQTLLMVAEGLDEVKYKGNQSLGTLVELMKFLEEKEILSEDDIKTVLERATTRIDGALEKPKHGPSDGPTL
ncbi:MAG: hypothetical protein IIC26_02090, partial [Chloroflexi bacterium]|nr:hypothetical protein [Chloroflexota bacterium]